MRVKTNPLKERIERARKGNLAQACKKRLLENMRAIEAEEGELDFNLTLSNSFVFSINKKHKFIGDGWNACRMAKDDGLNVVEKVIHMRRPLDFLS